jgi:AraC-like DNA-binding protein
MESAKPIKTQYRYFPVAKRDRDWGLYITTAGASQIGPNSSYPPSGHPKQYSFEPTVGRSLSEHQVIYISGGSGWFKSAGGPKQQVESGHVILLFPGVRHSYAPSPGTGWNEHWVGFNGDMAQRLMRYRFFKRSQPVFRINDEEKFLTLFNDIIETTHTNRPASQQILAALTINILALIYSDLQSNRTQDEPDLKAIQGAIARMRESAETSLNIPDLAREFKVNYRSFRRAFTRHTGFSPHNYLLEIRLARARTLLLHSSLSIKEIAARTGFEDSRYFCRFFHKKIGMPPGLWRMHAQKGNIH